MSGSLYDRLWLAAITDTSLTLDAAEAKLIVSDERDAEVPS